MNKQVFADPGIPYRGVTLWMLNDKLEVDEIARQLRGFHKAGWGAVITRTFNGLRTEYLSEEWMQVLERIVAQAAELDMKVWFQAGYMPSAMPDLDPSMAHWMLTRKEKAEEIQEDENVLAEDDNYVYVERRLGHVLDLLDPVAADNYLKKAYEETWLDRFGQDFGGVIEAIWVDEPHFRPPLLPWSKALLTRFETKWGYDLADHLPSLFVKQGDFKMIRHHYWRIIVDMFLESYFVSVNKWCQANNVRFSGHLMGEDTLNNQIAWTGAAMPCYEYMQLPGIDHLTMSLTWPTGKKFLLTPKQCTSASHQLGKDLILAEMYAVSSQGMTFEDRKQIGEWLLVLGMNYRCYHGSFYSLRGRRKRIYPPHLSHQQPWWSENRAIADYFARLSYALRQGDYQAEVLVLHSVESAFCLYDTLTMTQAHDRTLEAEDVKTLDTKLVNLCDNLLSIQRSFDFGDETLLAKYGKVTEADLQMGQMCYKVVVLPDMLTIRSSTLELLKAFAAAGGRIIAAGELPERIDGVPDNRVKELESIVEITANESAELQAALTDACPADIELIAAVGSDASSVWVHPRTLEGGKLYYLHNTNREAHVMAEFRIRGAGRLERWDPRTAEVAEVPQSVEDGYTVATLSFPPLGSHLVVLWEDEHPGDVKPKPEHIAREVAIMQRPTIMRHDPNALTLDYCHYRKSEGEWSNVLPVLTVCELLTQEEYEGNVALQFTFEVAALPSTLCVVMEDAANYEIVVNGHAVRYEGLPYWIDRSFHPVDIVDLVKQGTNTIELSTRFSPVPKASFSLARLFAKLEGTELESIYLIGDFAVEGKPSAAESKPRCIRFGQEFRITAERESTSGDLVSDGYPFFAGRISLTDTVSLEMPAAEERVVLELPAIDAAALVKVRVNDAEAGVIMWSPYELDITSLVESGENKIAVELISTLRNLLGPHHRPQGEPDQCWGTDYTLYPNWLKDEEEQNEKWTDDYFFLNFGIAQKVCIKYLSPSSG
ncbi:glycosyl hydrolase [Candidatus Poribacteria bacterium]